LIICSSVETINNKAERAIRPILTYSSTLYDSRPQKDTDNFIGIYSLLESYREKEELKGILTTG